MHAHLSHTARGEEPRTYHPIGVGAQVLLRGVVAGETHYEHLAEDRRLRPKHGSANARRHLLTHRGELLAHDLPGQIDIGAPIEFHPHHREAIGRLRPHSAHTGATVHGRLNGEGYELLHLFGRHAPGFGHDDHGGGVEVWEHIYIGLAGRIQAANDEQHRRHQHQYSVLKRESYDLV